MAGWKPRVCVEEVQLVGAAPVVEKETEGVQQLADVSAGMVEDVTVGETCVPSSAVAESRVPSVEDTTVVDGFCYQHFVPQEQRGVVVEKLGRCPRVSTAIAVLQPYALDFAGRAALSFTSPSVCHLEVYDEPGETGPVVLNHLQTLGSFSSDLCLGYSGADAARDAELFGTRSVGAVPVNPSGNGPGVFNSMAVLRVRDGGTDDRFLEYDRTRRDALRLAFGSWFQRFSRLLGLPYGRVPVVASYMAHDPGPLIGRPPFVADRPCAVWYTEPGVVSVSGADFRVASAGLVVVLPEGACLRYVRDDGVTAVGARVYYLESNVWDDFARLRVLARDQVAVLSLGSDYVRDGAVQHLALPGAKWYLPPESVLTASVDDVVTSWSFGSCSRLLLGPVLFTRAASFRVCAFPCSLIWFEAAGEGVDLTMLA